MQGASQIKLMAGGGVRLALRSDRRRLSTPRRNSVPPSRPPRTGAPTSPCTPTRRAAIRRAIAAGVKCIEHGQLIDEATAKLMADKGIWWSLQPFLDDEDAIPCTSPAVAEEGAGGLRRHGPRLPSSQRSTRSRRPSAPTSCSTPTLASRQGAQLAKLVALVHAGRGPQDGDRRQRRVAGAVRIASIPTRASSASSRRARSPISCWSTAIRWRTSSSLRTRTRTSSSS